MRSRLLWLFAALVLLALDPTHVKADDVCFKEMGSDVVYTADCKSSSVMLDLPGESYKMTIKLDSGTLASTELKLTLGDDQPLQCRLSKNANEPAVFRTSQGPVDLPADATVNKTGLTSKSLTFPVTPNFTPIEGNRYKTNLTIALPAVDKIPGFTITILNAKIFEEPSATTAKTDYSTSEKEGTSNGTVIGMGVGLAILGVAALLSTVAAVVYFLKWRKDKPKPRKTPILLPPNIPYPTKPIDNPADLKTARELSQKKEVKKDDKAKKQEKEVKQEEKSKHKEEKSNHKEEKLKHKGKEAKPKKEEETAKSENNDEKEESKYKDVKSDYNQSHKPIDKTGDKDEDDKPKDKPKKNKNRGDIKPPEKDDDNM